MTDTLHERSASVMGRWCAAAVISWLVILAGCDVNAASTPAAPAPVPAQARQFVVVELFQSQGCSSCPPANANVNALSRRDDVLSLMYGVTYWDQLGWTDSFARREFTERQRDYARGLGNANVYTPQVVLNGRRDIVGSNRAELNGAIAQAAHAPLTASVTVSGDSVAVSSQAPTARADVWLVRYDPTTQNVPIRAGENGGRTLPHINVVRQLVRLGDWDGRQSATFALPPNTRPALRTAVLVQARDGGPILGAARGG